MEPHNMGNNKFAQPLMKYGGTAKECCTGPPLGLMDIGFCEEAYLFRVSLPGLRKKECNVRCEIQRDGSVYIRGEIPAEGGGILRGSMGAYQLRVQQHCSPGPFALSFQLPGPVDPRLFSPNFRGDGIFEGVVMKHRVPVANVGGVPPHPV